MVATQRTLLATILLKLSGKADDLPLRVRFYKDAKGSGVVNQESIVV